uniref:Tripartite motif-containing protein 61 n=1 Tax=Castor canadensis TaxID=51338 RepID=A0A8C0ZTF3_CASCN
MSLPTSFVQDSEEFETAWKHLQAQASCPICLEYFKNPVTINCGHNFCLPCIKLFWSNLQDSFPCPSCHFLCPERKFSSNPQLGNLAEIAMLLPIRRSKRKRPEEKFMCKKHKQPLVSFCQKDLEVLCRHCGSSPDHQHHYIWPIQKAAVCHRKQLEHYTELWKERVERIEKVIPMQARKAQELKKKMKIQSQKLFSHALNPSSQEAGAGGS